MTSLYPAAVIVVFGFLMVAIPLARAEEQAPAKPDAAKASTRTVTKISLKGVTALVDTQDAPDLKDWGNQAGTLCVQWFPKTAALLPSPGFVAPNEVTLYFDPKMNGVAYATDNKITISAAYVRAHKDDFGMVIHELTHVVQAYPSGGPPWLVEGVADYIRIGHFEPHAPRPKLDPAKAKYTDAYKTAAMFLEWIEKHHTAGVVKGMNELLRQSRYTDSAWKTLTGKTVDELWALFVKTLP